MGFALSWIGVRGKPSDAVLADLRLRRTGEQEEIAEPPIVCATLRTGWFIVVMNGGMDAFDGTISTSTMARSSTSSSGCRVPDKRRAAGGARSFAGPPRRRR